MDSDTQLEHSDSATGPTLASGGRRKSRQVTLTVVEDGGVRRATQAARSGTWVLLDHFESEGQRYFLAREGEPERTGIERLTARERQILDRALLGHHGKLIAHDLGIADSTVRVLIARAAGKMGCASRTELIELYRRLRAELDAELDAELEPVPALAAAGGSR
ncbi:MAG: LuxR C-terminal-related transcriptional regulator [Polyangiaceae bacterium]